MVSSSIAARKPLVASSRCSSRSAAAPRAPAARNRALRVSALGGGNAPDKPAKKVLRREEEPEQYWTSKAERNNDPKAVLKDPAAVIGIVAIFLPFVILGIAIATGVVEIPQR